MTRVGLPLVSLFVLCLAVPGVAAPAQVHVVASDESRIVLRCDPAQVVVSDVAVDGREYAGVTMARADVLGIAGQPMVPVVRATIAVPPCESIDVRVSFDGSSSREGVRVVPCPTIIPATDGGISAEENVEGSAYSAGGLWPPEAAHVFGPSWLATQRVVDVEFYPCQTDPSRDLLVSHGSIEVEIVFRGVLPRAPERGVSPRTETLLRTALLNYEDGKAWRARPVPRTGRPTGDYFSTSEHWAKLRVRERGIYRVGYGDLAAAGIAPANVDPRTMRVFYGGGLSLPAGVADPRPTWMEECSILVRGEEDGEFDPADGVVFYGLGVDGWADELGVEDADEPYYENRYASENVYWLTWEEPGTPSGFADPPRRMQTEPPDSTPDPVAVRSYEARSHFEQNTYEWQGRGDNWFWYEMKQDGVAERRYFLESLDHVVGDSTATLLARFEGSSSVFDVYPDHYAVLSLNGVEGAAVSWDGLSPVVVNADSLPTVEGTNTIQVFVPRQDAGHFGDRILIDWFDLHYWRELWAVSDRLAFGSSGKTGIVEYSIGGFGGTGVAVFKIGDKYTQYVVPGVSMEDSRAVFQDDVPDTASYLAVSEDGYLSPEIQPDVFGDLRTPTSDDYIMITYDGFYEQALELKSLRESEAGGGFSVRPVKVSDVYDEFSWGLVDPAAIRDYLKYTWENAVVPPTHVVLAGDGNSDYRQYLASSRPTYIPVFYAGGATYWPADSWFVGFDSDYHYHLGMALGRLPARSQGELATMIGKIERYEGDFAPGAWRNTAVVVGDDEYRGPVTACCEYFHTEQSERLSRECLPWPLDRKKIYLMEYERSIGDKKPAARRDLIQAWNKGALIMNYTGHGNEIVMAHEDAFLFDDVSLLTNLDELPLYFAASCRLNKFDMPAVDSLGEALVKSARGGAIASIGSTRDSSASDNAALNRAFYSALFGHQQETTAPALDIGMAFQAAFATGANWENNTEFMIIGDPGLTLAAPRGSGAFAAGGLEPMRRRDTIAIEGTNAGSTAGLSGVALVRATDSADTSGYLHTIPAPAHHVDYRLPGKTMFEGPVDVRDGVLDAGFVVSALADEGPYARLRAYFYSDETDGSYSLEDVAIADSVSVEDSDGPAIGLEFEGGGTSILPGADLLVSISDPHGVNLVDRRPRDGIVVTVDGVSDSTYVTDDFVYDLGSYREGSLTYRLPDLPFGGHTVSVRASDNIGNHSKASISFEVVSAGDFAIRNVANHPNPFPDGDSAGTTILYELPVAADVVVNVFTVGGRLIRTIAGVAGVAGANQVYWDGRDEEGDELANGVYLYMIQATSLSYRGDKAEAIGRAVVMR